MVAICCVPTQACVDTLGVHLTKDDVTEADAEIEIGGSNFPLSVCLSV